jgi:hypothetical protein
VSFFRKLLTAFHRSDDLKTQLFAFLTSDLEELTMLGGKKIARPEARELLQELIPAAIEIRGVCQRPVAVVAAAPHVSFDNWSEHFCNHVAQKFSLGWVVAKNFRDKDPHSIPVSIGRHIHVNRPTESVRFGGFETPTERAEAVHQEYLAALAKASGREALPLDLLLEFHAHHRTPYLEVATQGVTSEMAMEIAEHYDRTRIKHPLLPEIQIEPIHELRLKAEHAKQLGSLRPEVARLALHLEIPRHARRTDEGRYRMRHALYQLTEFLLDRVAKPEAL